MCARRAVAGVCGRIMGSGSNAALPVLRRGWTPRGGTGGARQFKRGRERLRGGAESRGVLCSVGGGASAPGRERRTGGRISSVALQPGEPWGQRNRRPGGASPPAGFVAGGVSERMGIEPPAALLPQPGKRRLRGRGGLGCRPEPPAPAGWRWGWSRISFSSPRSFWQCARLSPLLDAILGEKGRSRYINPSLDVVTVGADLGQVLQLQGS